MNISPLLSVYPWLALTRGDLNTGRRWTDWTGRCEACGKETAGLQDLFCANYPYRRGRFAQCHKSRCYDCYKLEDNGDSPIKGMEEVDGFELEEAEKLKFLTVSM